MPSTATSILDGLSTSVAVKAPVAAVTSGNITLSGLQGHTEDDRILVWQQTTGSENGIYSASSGTWTRTKDFDGNRDVRKGTLVPVQDSAIMYRVTTSNPIVIGTSSIQFEAIGPTQTQADIGLLFYPRTDAEIDEGVTPVSYAYEPYHAFRYMTAAQITDVTARTLTLDVSTPLQNLIDAAASAGEDVTLPPGSYLIGTGLTGYSNMTITGAPRDSTLLYYNGATTLSGAMLKFSAKTAYAVRHVGFRCGRVQTGNATVMLSCEDAVYVEISDCTFGGGGITSTNNEVTGILCEQTTDGFVPPRGSICIRNILYVLETPDSGDSGSYGIRIKGHASQSMINVVLEGEGNLEHAYYAISFENVNNSTIGAWQLRGNASAEIRLLNCASCKIDSTQVIPAPTTGTGIVLDANCLDNLLLNIGWNFSSGAPLAALDDSGGRTTFWPPGAPGGGLNQQGKFYGPLQHNKADGVGPHLQLVRSATDTTVSGLEILKTGQSMGAPAFIAVDIGTGIGGMDIERFEAGSTTLERMDGNGQRYLHAPASDPGAVAMTPSQITFYLDESGHNLIVRAQYSDGSTNRIGTIALV